MTFKKLPEETNSLAAELALQQSVPSFGALVMSSAQPVKLRGDQRILTLNKTGAYDKIPADLAKEDELPEVPIVPCPTCGRKFREDRVEKHHAACEKLSDGSNRRGAFNSSKK